MRLSTLVAGFEVEWLCAGDPEIRAITVDEREVGPGTLFIARRGYYGDGHDRLAAAQAAGAAALVVSDPRRLDRSNDLPALLVARDDPFLGELSARFYGQPTAQLQVYGVTGTNGKTSVCYLLEHMLRALGERPAVMGTIDYRFGAAKHSACNTTPDALFVHRFARKAIDAGATSIVMEVSSHALAIERVAGVLFDSVGFTNLSHEHLDFHGDFAAYYEAKQRLFSSCLQRALAAGKQPRAVAWIDDRRGDGMLGAAPPGVETYSVSSERAAPRGQFGIRTSESLGLGGNRFEIRSLGRVWEGRTQLLGEYNLANIALACAMVAGSDPARMDAAVESVATFPGVPGRLELVVPLAIAGRGLFVDYAHTPDALERALTELHAVASEPATAVFGCGGDRDPSKRPLMAQVAQSKAGRVIATSDNPRTEAPEQILDAVFAGFGPGARHVERTADRGAAIEQALDGSGSGPILVAGKGHETYQDQDHVRYHFDDREEIRRIVAGQYLGRSGVETPLLFGWPLERIAATTQASVQGWKGPFVSLSGQLDPRGAERLELLGPEAADQCRPSGTAAAIVSGRPGVLPRAGPLARLVAGVLSEARQRSAGLWTMAVVTPDKAEGEALCQAIAEQLARPILVASYRGDYLHFGTTLAELAAGDQGVIGLGDARPDAWEILHSWLAPDIVVAPELIRRRVGSEPSVVTLSLPAAQRLTETQWAQHCGRAVTLARRRHGSDQAARPIPVPDALGLRSW